MPVLRVVGGEKMEDKAKLNTLIQDLFFFSSHFKRNNSWLVVFILSHHSISQWHSVLSHPETLFVQVEYQTADALLFISQVIASTRGFVWPVL